MQFRNLGIKHSMMIFPDQLRVCDMDLIDVCYGHGKEGMFGDIWPSHRQIVEETDVLECWITMLEP